MLNAGDAAILKSMIAGMEQKYGPDTEFVIYDSQAEAARRYYPDLTIKSQLQYVLRSFGGEGSAAQPGLVSKIRRKIKQEGQRVRAVLSLALLRRGWINLARALMPARVRAIFDDYVSVDMIIGTGGTYIVENYSIKRRYDELSFSLATGRPVVLFTQSMGPFTEERNREMLSQVFPKCALILLRDEASYEHCKSVNTADNMQVSADAVFVTAVEKEVAEAGEAIALRPKRVAISVRHWPYFKNDSPDVGMKRYLKAVRQATEFVIDTYGAQVTFISTCQGIPEYWVDDAKVAQRVFDELDPVYQASVTVNSDFNDPFDLQAKLADFDLVIATRLHVAILSLTRGTPVVPISYEFKTTELFRRFGIGKYVSDIDTVTGDELAGKIERFVEHYSSFNKQLFEGVLSEHRRAEASFDALDYVFDLDPASKPSAQDHVKA